MDELFKAIQDQPFALLGFGAVLAIIFGVRHLGLWQGERRIPAASEAQAQVAAVIVDPTALKEASASVDGLTVTLTETNMAIRRLADHQKALADELDNVREEMRIHREVSRR